jgi:hypothetical protein
MKHEEFRIGIQFWCGGRRWRCTDVGSRTVVGICLEPHEVVSVVSVTGDVEGSGMTTRTITADDSWLVGPPYAVAEEVFDEHSIQGCTLSPDAEAE